MCTVDRHTDHMYITFNLQMRSCTMVNVPRSCRDFYQANVPPADGNIDESDMMPRIRMILDDLLNDTSSTSENHDSCVQLVRRYFCDFYWPVCDVTTGNIHPACTSSCNLLLNNEVCSDLLMHAIDMVMEQGISVVPSSNSCTRTFLPLPGTPEPQLADTCINIEGQLHIYTY